MCLCTNRQKLQAVCQRGDGRFLRIITLSDFYFILCIFFFLYFLVFHMSMCFSTRTKGSLAQWKELRFAVHGAGAPTSVRLESAVCVVLGMWCCPSEPLFLTYRLGTTTVSSHRSAEQHPSPLLPSLSLSHCRHLVHWLSDPGFPSHRRY